MQAVYEILENKNLRSDYTHALVDSCVALKDGMFQWSAGKVCSQFAFSLSERNTCFNWSFEKLARLSGFEVEEAGMELDRKQKEDADDSMEKAKYLEQQREITMISDILERQKNSSTRINKSDLERIKKRIKTQTETQDELQQDKVLTAYFKYEESFRDQLQWTDIVATIEKAHLLDNAWMFLKTHEEWQAHDLMKLQYAAMPEKLIMRKLRFDGIGRLLTSFGFMAGGKAEEINVSVVNDNAELMFMLTKELARLDDRTNEAKTPLEALKKELKYCGLELGKRRLHTGEVETKGKYKGQKRKESWYRLAKLKKLKSITILDDPDAVDNTPCPEEKEKPKPGKVTVLLQHLLPHYKKLEELKPLNDSDDDDEWEPADRKRGLEEGEGDNESKKQRI